MAGSACYNIVYMSERVSTSNTCRVTGGDRKKQEKTGKNNSHVIKKRRVILSLLIQMKVDNLVYLLVFLFCSNLLRPVGDGIDRCFV